MMTSSMFAEALSSSESEDEAPLAPRRVDNRFTHYMSDEEDEKRIVKSAKDKRFEEMQSIIKNMNNHKKIKDMGNVLLDFENLIRVNEKSLKMNEYETSPAFHIRCIAELEDFVNDSWEKKKELNRGAAKSLTALRQRVKKYNRDFEENIKDFREHPENYQEDVAVDVSDAEEGASDDEESYAKGTTGMEKKTGRKSAPSESGSKDSDEANEDESDSDDFWDSDSSSSSSSDVDMERFKDDPSVMFLKKTGAEKKEKTKVKRSIKERSTKKASRVLDAESLWIKPQIQAFEKGIEVTHEVVVKKLEEILANRGRKGTSINDQLMLLHQVEDKIKEHHLSVGLHVKVLFSLISVFFEYDKNSSPCMSNSLFQRLLSAFDRLFDVLNGNEVQLVGPDTSGEEEESLENPPFVVRGSALTASVLLDRECNKILQNANGHELEYVDRLKDERHVCAIFDSLCSYLENRNADSADLCTAYLLKVEHIYYKFDFVWAKQVEADGIEAVGKNATTIDIECLCQYIYSHDRTDRLRTRAILCHIYHLAMYDEWFKARDLMLMSNLQMSIERADQSTQILYNRALVQLGLAAFRQGHIRETHNALVDLVGSGRIRELLAQGLHTQTRYERSPEEEKREQTLQVPYHMYINTDLLETVYHVSAMLLEIPNLAAHETDLRWRPISKPFHNALRVHDRATLVGPPETPRDHVLAAAKAMRYGNWEQCTQFIINPKMDAKIWDVFFQSKRVKQILEVKIKEESLRSFLFTYSAIHDSISLDRLAEYFKLPKSTVYSIISKMIINQELAASLEVPSDFLIMHKTERSRLQTLALQLSDKINSIVEMNEKLIESRGSGGTGGLLGAKGGQTYQGIRRQGMRYGLTKFN